MTTLDLKAAAEFLGMHKETLRERAAAGIIVGAKCGRAWRFMPADLEAYFRSKCHSTAVPIRSAGGSCYGTAGEELDARLRLVIGKSPSGSTTNSRPRSGSKSKRVAV